jgi:hypothetical protein
MNLITTVLSLLIVASPASLFYAQQDLSGEWLDSNGRKWTATQKGNWVSMSREDKLCNGGGKLNEQVINYRGSITMSGNVPAGCEEFNGVAIYYDAYIAISDDWNRLDNRVPDTVVQDRCVVPLKKMTPELYWTRIR